MFANVFIAVVIIFCNINQQTCIEVIAEDSATPLYGAYKNFDNDAGFYVTDTYLKSAEYTNNAAGFVKKTGDTMSGSLNLSKNNLLGVNEINFGSARTDIIGYDASLYAMYNEEGKYSVYNFCAGNSMVPAGEAILRGVKAPMTKYDAVNLEYLQEYCEGKTQEVTLTGVVDTILAHDAEYTIKEFTALTLVCDSAKTAENHGYIKFPNVAVVPTLTGFSGIDGDDITKAAANEVWEFSCFKGYMLFKNWGVAA